MAPEQPTAGRAILTTATRSTGRTSRRREQERTGPRYTFQKSCGVLKPLSESLPGSSPQCFMRRQQMRPNATAYRLCGCGCGVPTPPATKTHSIESRPAMHERKTPFLSELRRAGHRRVYRMAHLFHSVLSRCWAASLGQALSRPNRQWAGILLRQCSVGVRPGAEPKHTKKSARDLARSNTHPRGVGRTAWYIATCAHRPSREWMASRTNAVPAGTTPSDRGPASSALTDHPYTKRVRLRDA